MKRPNIPVDNTLLISRFQQKELYQDTLGTSNVSPTMAQLPTFKLHPFFDTLAIKIGLELKLLGSRIISCQVERGFLFHDLEYELSKQSVITTLFSIKRIQQKTPLFYQLSLLSAYEKLFGIQSSTLIKTRRAIGLEINRIYHHFNTLKDVFMCLNAHYLFDNAKLGKSTIKPFQKKMLTVTDEPRSISLEGLKQSTDEIIQIIEDMESTPELSTIIASRLKRKAFINLSTASSMGLTGAFVRANRCIYDLRLFPHHSLDYVRPPKTAIIEGGDAYARLFLRMRDIHASAMWIKDRISEDKNIFSSAKLIENYDVFSTKNLNARFAFGEIEGPEGDIKTAIFINENNTLSFHIRTPAFFVAQAIPEMLLYTDLSDLAVLMIGLGITAEEIDK